MHVLWKLLSTYLLCTKYIFNQMSSRKALGLESYRHLVRLESSATCIENRQFSNRRNVCKPTQSANQSALLLTVAANKSILDGTQATSPEGVKRTQIQVASLQPGPLDDGSPGDGRRPIEVVKYLGPRFKLCDFCGAIILRCS
jgi:hypothetical protein